jgi:hypothetical protein
MKSTNILLAAILASASVASFAQAPAATTTPAHTPNPTIQADKAAIQADKAKLQADKTAHAPKDTIVADKTALHSDAAKLKADKAAAHPNKKK